MKLLRIFCYWGKPQYTSTSDIVGDRAIICLVPFGTINLGDHLNPSNQALANKSLEYQGLLGCELGLQWEFSELSQNAVVVGKPGGYINTREYFQFLKKEVGAVRILILAHPLHAMRCKWVAEKIGFEVIGILDPGQVPYSPGNAHRQVRNSTFYIFWERLSRLHHMIKGWI